MLLACCFREPKLDKRNKKNKKKVSVDDEVHFKKKSF